MTHFTARILNATKLSDVTCADIPLASSSVASETAGQQNRLAPTILGIAPSPVHFDGTAIVVSFDEDSLRSPSTSLSSTFLSVKSTDWSTEMGSVEIPFWTTNPSSPPSSLHVIQPRGPPFGESDWRGQQYAASLSLSMAIDEEVSDMSTAATTKYQPHVLPLPAPQGKECNTKSYDVDRRCRRGHVRHNNVDFPSTVLPYLGPELVEAVVVPNSFTRMTPANEVATMTF